MTTGPSRATRHARLAELFTKARALPPDERTRFLCDLEGGPDAGLLLELRGLLEAAEKPAAALDPSEILGPLPKSIAGYRVLGKLGGGGMGEVYLAEQGPPLSRRVALKVIRADVLGEEALARFALEQQALASMNHDNIARVYEAGHVSDGGEAFLVMEYVPDAEPITDYCDRRRLTIDARLALYHQVCRAVSHAHGNAILHRDIKADNVLVTECDGRPIVKVIDFGVAKRIGSEACHTLGGVVGTLEYLSPEQAGRDPDAVDERTDVHALGVLLYVLLTECLPLEGLRDIAIDEALRLLREASPPSPSQRVMALPVNAASPRDRGLSSISALSRRLAGDLDWITCKALESEPSRRYGTVDELLEDLERHARGQPVVAGPPSASYRLKKFASRHRRVLALIALLGLVCAGSWWATQRSIRGEARGVLVRELRAEDPGGSFRALVRLVNDDPRSARSIAEALHGVRLSPAVFVEGPEVSSTPPQQVVDVIRAVHPIFIESRQLFGAMCFAVQEARIRDSWERGSRDRRSPLYGDAELLLTTLRSAFAERHPAHRPPTWRADSALNARIALGPGNVRMGSPPGVGREDERPQRTKTVPSFLLQSHEVTNGEYRRFDPSRLDQELADDLPVVNITWYEAIAYAAWLGGRLPTEAQWEYAARAGTTTEYCSGNSLTDLDRVAWFRGNTQRLMPVAQKEPCGNGLYDMHGNVWEWCRDWYEPYSAYITKGPPSARLRIRRGGSYEAGGEHLRSASRGRGEQHVASEMTVGFRVCWPSVHGRSTRRDDERMLALRHRRRASEATKLAAPSIVYHIYHDTDDDERVNNVVASAALAQGKPALRMNLMSHDEAPVPADAHARYFVSEDDLSELRESPRTLRLEFTATGQEALRALRKSERVVLEVARTLGGRTWDDGAWVLLGTSDLARRIESWTDETPNVVSQIAVHEALDGSTIRLSTSGMKKFGLPDIALSKVIPDYTDEARQIVVMVCQHLVEGVPLSASRSLRLDPTSRRNRKYRETFDGVDIEPTTVRLSACKPGPHDPRNRSLEITLPGTGSDVERQVQAFANLLRPSGGSRYVQHDAAVRAASERARERLFSVYKPRVSAGLQPLEWLRVKASFPIGDSHGEWMWIDVLRWDDAEVHGILLGHPHLVRGLERGTVVTVDESAILDYLFRGQDGSEEGNETGEANPDFMPSRSGDSGPPRPGGER